MSAKRQQLFDRPEVIVEFLRGEGVEISLREVGKYMQDGTLRSDRPDKKYTRQNIIRMLKIIDLGNDEKLLSAVRYKRIGQSDLEMIRNEERTRLLALVSLVIGQESADRIRALLESGATSEQISVVMAMDTNAPTQGADCSEFKKEMLSAIQAAGAGNPGGGKSDTAAGKDYLVLVDEYVAVHKVSKNEALKKVASLHPDKHREYIEKSQIRQVK